MKTPIPTDHPSYVPPQPADVLPEERVGELVDLALGAADGETFTLGGREFRRQWLMLDAEQDLQVMLVELIKKAPTLELADVLTYSAREVQHAAALIIADYDHPGAEPAAVAGHRADALRWLRTTRGISTNQLLQVVLGQIALNELGVLLGKLLTVLGPLGLIAVPRHPLTSAGSASSAGPGSEPAPPSA